MLAAVSSNALLDPGSSRERRPHTRKRLFRRAEHELRVEPQDAPAEPRELPVPAGIGGGAPGVAATINFDDQPPGGHGEVRDEVSEHDLTAGRNAQFSRTNQPPQRLRCGWARPAEREPGIRGAGFGGALDACGPPDPAAGPGSARPWRTRRDTRGKGGPRWGDDAVSRRMSRVTNARGATGAPLGQARPRRRGRDAASIKASGTRTDAGRTTDSEPSSRWSPEQRR